MMSNVTRAGPILLSWSGGKDSALALARLRGDPGVEVIGLLTTVTTGYERISIHGVRRVLLHEQAAALGLPVIEIAIAPQSSNEAYERAWADALGGLPRELADARHVAFGDIFLEDVRSYRELMTRSLGFEAVFPLWGEDTRALAKEVVAGGFAARVVCVDTEQLSPEFAGRSYDAAFLAELPAAVDPCGERGEFHTFVLDGPAFAAAVRCHVGATVLREDRFAYTDLLRPADPPPQ